MADRGAPGLTVAEKKAEAARIDRKDPVNGWVDFYRYDREPTSHNPNSQQQPQHNKIFRTYDVLHDEEEVQEALNSSSYSSSQQQQTGLLCSRDIDIDNDAEYRGQQRRAQDLAAVGDAVFPLLALCCSRLVAACLGEPPRALVVCARLGARKLAARLVSSTGWAAAAPSRPPPREPQASAGRFGPWGDGEGDAFEALCVCCATGDVEFAEWMCGATGGPGRHILELRFYQRLVRLACGSGSLNMVKYLVTRLYRQFHLRSQDRFAWRLVQAACRQGSLDVVKWVCDEYHLRKTDPGDPPNLSLNQAICICCSHGHTQVLEWLVNKFLVSYQMLAYNNSEAVRLCCNNGHFETLKWLQGEYRLEKGDMLACSCEALKSCCEKGYLDIFKWLIETFSVTCEDVADHNLFQICCQTGNMELIRWFSEKFTLTQQDISADGYGVLWNALVDGNLDLSKWLVTTFRLTAEFLRSNTFSLVCSAGFLDCAQWMVSTFGAPPATVIDGALEGSIKNGHKEVARWLLDITPTLTRTMLRGMLVPGFLPLLKHVVQSRCLIIESTEASDLKYTWVTDCAKSGSLETAIWLLNEFQAPLPIMEILTRAFSDCCSKGDLPFIRWMEQLISDGIAHDFLMGPHCEEYNLLPCLKVACKKGFLPIIQILLSKVVPAKVPKGSPQRERLVEVVSECLRYGHIGVASWVIDQYKVDSDELLPAAHNVFHSCSGTNRIRTLKWAFPRIFPCSSIPASLIDSNRMPNEFVSCWVSYRLNYDVPHGAFTRHADEEAKNLVMQMVLDQSPKPRPSPEEKKMEPPTCITM
ncbi:hypothetical protein Pelo_16688 [Pelomyxa schiedti]|nr:hypothetical protein Pelo_16688 [Pelomyxa schiedti]